MIMSCSCIEHTVSVDLSPVGPSLENPRLTFPLVTSATGIPSLTDWSSLEIPRSNLDPRCSHGYVVVNRQNRWILLLYSMKVPLNVCRLWLNYVKCHFNLKSPHLIVKFLSEANPRSWNDPMKQTYEFLPCSLLCTCLWKVKNETLGFRQLLTLLFSFGLCPYSISHRFAVQQWWLSWV